MCDASPETSDSASSKEDVSSLGQQSPNCAQSGASPAFLLWAAELLARTSLKLTKKTIFHDLPEFLLNQSICFCNRRSCSSFSLNKCWLLQNTQSVVSMDAFKYQLNTHLLILTFISICDVLWFAIFRVVFLTFGLCFLCYNIFFVKPFLNCISMQGAIPNIF